MEYIEEELSRIWQAMHRPEPPIHVVFVLQLQTFWPLFESVALALKKYEAFSSVVLLTSHLQSNVDMDHIQYDEDGLRDLGLTVVRDVHYNIHKAMPDVAFFSSPYTATRKVCFMPELLRVHHTRTAVIPYCTEVMGDASFLRLYFDSCRGNWRYFTSSAMCRKGYSALKQLPDFACPVVGNPEYDFVLNRAVGDLKKYQMIREKAGGRKVLLWTPHYSDGWGTFERLGMSMIQYFSSLADSLFVVLRPHQILSGALYDAERGAEEGSTPPMREAVRAMRDAGNFYIDAEGAGIESVYAAHGLVSDLSSMLTKGMALGKSTFFLKNHGHDDAGPAGGIMNKHMHTGFDVEAVRQFTAMLLDGNDPLLPVPADVRDYFCGPVDGKAGERIAGILERSFFPS